MTTIHRRHYRHVNGQVHTGSGVALHSETQKTASASISELKDEIESDPENWRRRIVHRAAAVETDGANG